MPAQPGNFNGPAFLKKSGFFGQDTPPQPQQPALADGPSHAVSVTKSRPSHRRDSSLSSITDIGSSLRVRSNSLRGQPQGRPSTSDKAGHGRFGAMSGSKPPQTLPHRPSTASQPSPEHRVVSGSQSNPSLIFSRIQDIATKRISTLDYLKKAHEGRTYWFNTLFFNRADLLKLPYFDQQKLARRATNYFMLGNSIPAVLDPNAGSLGEYLRTFGALLAEFESFQNLHPPDGSSSSSLPRMKMPHMFKKATYGKSRRGSGAVDSVYAGSDASDHASVITTGSLSSLHGGEQELLPGEEYAHLLTPSLPFDPDYFETFATLCDVLIDCYTTVLSLVTTPESCGPQTADLFMKADGRVKKLLVINMVRDFEQSSRQGVRTEMAGVGKMVLGGLM